MSTSEGRTEIVKRLQGPAPPRLSSSVLMPQEPDLVWDLLLLQLRHEELMTNLRTATSTVAYGIAQEVRKNRQLATELQDRIGLSGSDLINLSRDTPPSFMSLSFGPIDGDPVEEPQKDDDFLICLRGRGLSFVTEISARLEFALAGTLRTRQLPMSRRSEDWEYVEFTAQKSLGGLGLVQGTEAAVLLEMKLKSGRTVTRCLKRFTCG